MTQIKFDIKFSVLVANYNNGKYVAEAIESVISQAFKDWELVIIDDCSTDNSVEIIKKYLNDKRIRLLKNSKNIGYVGTLKRLIQEADANIVGILDSDDALTEDALTEIYQAYEDHPECGFIYSQFVFCDRDLQPVKKGNCTLIPFNKSNIHEVYTVAFRTFKKDDYYKTGGYDEEILYAEDRDMIFKLEEVTKFYFVNEVLYKYRRLPDSHTTGQGKAEVSRVSHALAKYKAFLRRSNTNLPNLTKDQMAYQLFDAIPSCLKTRDPQKAKKFFSTAFKLSPFNVQGCIMLLFRLIKFPFFRIYRKVMPKKDILYGA